MDKIYKKRLKKRRKEVKKICSELKKNNSSFNSNDIMYVYNAIDTYSDNEYGIIDTVDAINVCNLIMSKIHTLSNNIKGNIKNMITIYLNLSYLYNFVEDSVIQNSTIDRQYSYISSYIDKYERDNGYI